ncbi:hypothetical protein Lser_V15G05178 [Lactuca serriola]
MGDALVTAIAERIHKKVVSIAAKDIALAWGYKKKLDTLEHTLKIICAKLRDTENEKGKNHGVMVWLILLKHVVGEADDLLDEVHYEMLRHEVVTRDKSRMISFKSVPSLKTFSIRRGLGHRIENITEKFFEMNEHANNLGLQNIHPHLVQDGVYQETDSCLDEFKIVGRESDEPHIIQLLTESRKEEKIRILPIVGMGGIGKTTLAKLVYNNPKIEQHFDARVWLCVSVMVDVDTVLAKICRFLGGYKCNLQTRVNLITYLQEKLGSKRYLVVLDGVWDREMTHWDDFQSCMLKVNPQNGSCILVTTRNLEIGSKAFNEEFHALQGLSDDDCWYIFKERVFVAGQSLLPELEEIGHDIVNKCRGLPLLVKVIGGMLRNYNKKEKWLSIRDSNVWDPEEEGDIVQNILKLSFDNLPNFVVKQCFTYCSIFNKDRVMNNKELIQLWMALGLVLDDESTKKEMEDVGNDIFQILVRSSMLQDVKRDEYDYFTYFGIHEIASCGMHDQVYDLSVSLSKHENSCLMLSTNNDILRIPQVKHLSVYQERNEHCEFSTKLSTVIKDYLTCRSLQTLFFEGEIEKTISFQRFNSIRILKLSCCEVEELDDSLGELVYLRFLDLSYTRIQFLPKSIGKLYHLQTLKLYGCYALLGLPVEMTNLISLRNLEFPKIVRVHKVGQLTSLRTLPFFGVHRWKGYQIEELGSLKHLGGEIQIFNLEEISSKEDALKADLSRKKNLYMIDFIWSRNEGSNRNDLDVLEGLQPPKNVKHLTIVNFSSDNLPAWVMKMAINIDGKDAPLRNLVGIKLSGCSSCLYLPILEYLPLLQDLVLQNMDNLTCLKSSLHQGDSVSRLMKPLSPSLRSLQLSDMKRLEKWIDTTTNSSTMISPVLETLRIHECPKIILLDECHPHPLVSLQIDSCDNLVSIKSIQGLKSLESLEIHKCPNLLRIPDLPHHGNSLKIMRIICSSKLTCLPREIFNSYSFLTKLSLGPFSNELHSFPSLQGIEKLRNHLRSLELSGWHHWESIPEEIKHLTLLTRLFIYGFGMQELPTWLNNMSSIRDMRFYDCPRLDKGLVKLGVPRGSGLCLLKWNESVY